MHPDDQSKIRSFLRKKPSKPAVAVLLILLVTVLLSRDYIADMARLKGVMDALAPDGGVIALLASRQTDPSDMLKDIWRSDKIPHRWEVINYLNHAAKKRPKLIEKMRPILAEAARDRDLTVRIAALNLARVVHQDYWLPSAIADLDDPDDDMRLEALHTLHRGKATNALPAILTRLHDPSTNVSAFALGVLHNFTGLPREALTKNAADAVSEWLRDSHTALAAPTNAPLFQPGPGPDCSDIWFEGTEGKALPLADLAGRPILICFLGTWSGDCMLQMPELRALKSGLGDKVHIIAVGIDPLSDASKKHGSKINPETAKKHVLRLAAIQRANYPVVFDPGGIALLRLEGAEIPAHVLLGPDLRVVRRFSGRRTATNLARIITALSPPAEAEPQKP
ncbi:MAG: TlpA family protein disulfide reductase [Verrucomicrobiae bacterium]|nr:TlpA family protein disulfide reductase [Verrucomicrobiae bacterium]